VDTEAEFILIKNKNSKDNRYFIKPPVTR